MKKHLRKIIAQAVASLPQGILTDLEHHDLFEARGVHIRPVHFYSSIPNTQELDRAIWDRPMTMGGIDQNIPEQAALFTEFDEKGWLTEYRRLPWKSASPNEFSRGEHFSGIDGAVLYSMIRKYQPRKVIEVGAGGSTLLADIALRKNEGKFSHAAIDPYPQPYLHAINGLEIIAGKVERVPLSLFDKLEANDILFIDSSHTVRIGGDVIHEVLEILPRLKPGVLVHIHDIFLPHHYPKEWVLKRKSTWTEQYLLQAFLAFNSAFKILWGFHMMMEAKPAMLKEMCEPHELDGGSLWICRT